MNALASFADTQILLNADIGPSKLCLYAIGNAIKKPLYAFSGGKIARHFHHRMVATVKRVCSIVGRGASYGHYGVSFHFVIERRRGGLSLYLGIEFLLYVFCVGRCMLVTVGAPSARVVNL